MTYREAIKNSLDKIQLSEEEGGSEMLPITAHLLVMNISALLVYCADELLKRTCPNVESTDIINVLNQKDFMRSLIIGIQFSDFLTWILDQEVNTDFDFEDDTVWYDFRSICEKWNEYASMRMEKEENDY